MRVLESQLFKGHSRDKQNILPKLLSLSPPCKNIRSKLSALTQLRLTGQIPAECLFMLSPGLGRSCCLWADFLLPEMTSLPHILLSLLLPVSPHSAPPDSSPNLCLLPSDSSIGLAKFFFLGFSVRWYRKPNELLGQPDTTERTCPLLHTPSVVLLVYFLVVSLEDCLPS